MDFNQEIILENDVVRLSPMRVEDLNLLLPFSLQEPELWEYSLQSAGGEANLKKYIENAVQSRFNESSYPFLVFDKRTNEYAGSTRFYDYQKGHNTVQLGHTWYGKDFQGTGLNKNCKYLILSYAFETMELDRVEFRADHNNKRSIAAMKSLGCIEEGVLRSNCAAPDGRRDSIILSILKQEWFDSVKANLEKRIRNTSGII